MSEGEFIEWLKLRGVSEKDCRTLTGIYGYIPSIAVCNYLMKKNNNTCKLHNTDNGITPSGFTLLDVEDFEGLGLTIIGKTLVQRALRELKS